MKKWGKKDIIAIGCIAFFSFSLLWRVFHGFDWSDDSYYIAIVYRLIQGDSLFQDCWDIHQLSAVILYPVYWIYTKIFGTTGIILFSRILFVILLSGEAFGLYYKFKEKSGYLWSALASIILLGYESNFGLSYNSMMILFFVMAALVLPVDKTGENLYIRYILSGFFSGLAIQAYPSTLIVLLCFIFFILINGKERRWRNLAFYCCGGLFVVLGFIVFLSVNSSFVALIKNSHYLLMDPEHGEIHFSMHDRITELKEMMGNRGIVILLVSSITAAISLMTRKTGKIFLRLVTIGGLIAFLFFQWDSIRFDYGKSSIQYRLFFAIALTFPTLWILNGLKWDYLLFLAIGGMLASIGVNIATNNGPTFYVYPYIVSAISTLLYVGKINVVSQNNTRAVRGLSVFQIVVAIYLAIYAFYSSFNFVYRDGDLKALNTKLISGPASGIYTTQERSVQYEQTIDSIYTYMPKKGQVLFIKLLPFGYLCTDAKPAIPRLWRTNLDYPLFDQYYQNNPEKKPDAIYLVNENYGITNSGIIIGEYMQNMINSTKHNRVDLECGTIITFIEDEP